MSLNNTIFGEWVNVEVVLKHCILSEKLSGAVYTKSYHILWCLTASISAQWPALYSDNALLRRRNIAIAFGAPVPRGL